MEFIILKIGINELDWAIEFEYDTTARQEESHHFRLIPKVFFMELEKVSLFAISGINALIFNF
jgi:hypothetical protein